MNDRHRYKFNVFYHLCPAISDCSYLKRHDEKGRPIPKAVGSNPSLQGQIFFPYPSGFHIWALSEIRSKANRLYNSNAIRWFLVKLCANSLPLHLYKSQPVDYSPTLRAAQEVLLKKQNKNKTNKIRAFSAMTAVLSLPILSCANVPALYCTFIYKIWISSPIWKWYFVTFQCQLLSDNVRMPRGGTNCSC